MRVLLAEDDPSLQSLFLRALTEAGCLVETAADGLELLRLGSSLTPDVVISDIALPGCDGIRACSLLKAAKPGLRIILMTGDSNRARRAREAGFHQVLRKPFDLNELKRLVAPS